jgi:ABC-type molybdate transport system substrate-binding protein
VSEIIHEKGVAFAGLIPAEVQLNTVYAAGIIADGKAPDASAAFIRFLIDPANAKHWKDGGFDPPG